MEGIKEEEKRLLDKPVSRALEKAKDVRNIYRKLIKKNRSPILRIELKKKIHELNDYIWNVQVGKEKDLTKPDNYLKEASQISMDRLGGVI